jgi:hypothetical protein
VRAHTEDEIEERKLERVGRGIRYHEAATLYVFSVG